jgi:glycosyltransferase involved in cell wall biosynthesis
MKVLVVHEIDYLEKVIYEIQEFPELLAHKGYEITFFQFQEGARRTKGNHFRKKTIPGRVIPDVSLILRGPHQFGIPRIDRLWATLSSIPELISIFRRERPDVVLNYAVPTYGFQLLLLANMFRIPFVQRALDVSHEIRESIYRIPILLVEKFLYKHAPALSVNNSAMAEYCKAVSGRKIEPIVNYPPLDLSHFSVASGKSELRLKLGILDSDKVITYMGSFFYFSGLPEVIARFAQLTPIYSHVKLLLIGGGEQEMQLREMVRTLGLDSKVIFTGFVSYGELPNYLALSTVAINPLEIGRVASVAFPHKVLQYLAAGLPVVSTRLKGLFSALDRLNGLSWAESPTEVMDSAIALTKERVIPFDNVGVRKRLRDLFSPEAAMDSLVLTLQKAIKLRSRN